VVDRGESIGHRQELVGDELLVGQIGERIAALDTTRAKLVQSQLERREGLMKADH